MSLERAEKMRILVVDDVRDTADTAVVILNHLGYQAIAAYDGEQALKIAALLPPHVVLLDIGMPKIDGYQLAFELRKLPGMDNALLICVSGYGTRADKDRAYEAGCAYHFIKPVDWEELGDLLATARIDLDHSLSKPAPHQDASAAAVPPTAKIRSRSAAQTP
jgi:CheY-like chemotaxis protein